MKQTARVSEHADLRGLAVAIVAQAVRDLKHANPVKRLDALFWLTSDDFAFWIEIIDAPLMDPFKMLSSGGARKYKAWNYDR